MSMMLSAKKKLLNSSKSIIEIVASGSAALSGTSHAVPIPSGVQSGDVLIIVHVMNTDRTMTVSPSGWTLAFIDTADVQYSRVYARTATGAEGGTNVTFSLSGSGVGAYCVLVLRGAGARTIGAIQRGTGTTVVAPGDVFAAGLIFACFALQRGVNTPVLSTPPADMELIEFSGGISGGSALAVFAQVIDAGTAPSKTVVYTLASGTTFKNAGFQFGFEKT